MRLFLGIDPGLTGGIASIDHHGRLVVVTDVPAIAIPGAKGTVKRQVDASSLARVLRFMVREVGADETSVLIERVSAMPAGGTDSGRPRQGIASTFSLGESCGCIRGVVAALGMRWAMVAPQTWKRHYGLNRKRVQSACGQEHEDVKDLSRAVALRLFPAAELTRKKDHGRAEAILIAQFLFDEQNVSGITRQQDSGWQTPRLAPVIPLKQGNLDGFEAA